MNGVETVHLLDPETQGALCGALKPTLTTSDEAVTCALCGAMIDSRAALHGLVELARRRITSKLAELQRDPGVRVLTGFARSVLAAEREVRGREKGRR